MTSELEIMNRENISLQKENARLSMAFNKAAEDANMYASRVSKAEKILSEICKSCGEKDFPGGCQNDCYVNDIEKCLAEDETQK